MIPFKSIPAARYRPAHKCAQWGRSCSSRKTRKQTFMHFSHVRRMYKKKSLGEQCARVNEKSSCSKELWENSKDNSPIFPLYENYLRQRSLETCCQQPANLNWGGGRRVLDIYEECFLDRLFVRRVERKGDRKGETEGYRMDAGDEGCILSITEKVLSVRSAHEPSSRWLMPGRLRRTSEATHAWKRSHMLIMASVICF